MTDKENSYMKLAKRSEVPRGLYPDIFDAGNLAKLVNKALERIGAKLISNSFVQIEMFDLPEYARVQSEDRFSQIYVASEERAFWFDIWAKGICLGSGSSPDIDMVVSAIDAWISERTTLSSIATRFPFVSIPQSSYEVEKGRITEVRWQKYLANLEDPDIQLKPLVDFIQAAADEPVLRKLFPFTSMYWFCFSRCTGYPYTNDCPTVTGDSPGTYIVEYRDGRKFGGLDADAAVRAVIAGLPEDCGPAVEGTAEDMTAKDI